MTTGQDREDRAGSVLYAARILLGLALLALAFFRFVDPHRFASSLRALDLRYIPLAIVAYFAWRIASAWQLTYLLHSQGVTVPFWRAFRGQTIGLLFSTALPSDFAGAAATWFMLSRDTDKRTVVANALIHTRILSLMAVALIAFIGLIVDNRLASLPGAHFAAGIAATIFVCLALTLFQGGLILVELVGMKFLSVIPRQLAADRFRDIFARFFSEARSVRQLPLFAHLTLWSTTLLVNLGAAIIVFVSMRAAAIPLPFSVSLWLVALIAVIQIIPLTPGGLGVRELGIITVLKGAYDVMPEKALALATLILILNLVFGAGLGGYWMLFLRKQPR